MKKFKKHKYELLIGLLIIPITFIFLITFIGGLVALIDYDKFDFNLWIYWKYCFKSKLVISVSSLISLIGYFYYVYKVCFSVNKGVDIKKSFKNDYGSAKWLNKKEVNKLYPLVTANSNHHGFVVNTKLQKKNLFHNLKTDTHCLVIGGTGSGKTQALVLPTININAKSQVKPIMIITDVKGELYKIQGGILQAQGYNVQTFNLRNIKETSTWNPLQVIYDKFKKILLSNDQQEKISLKVQIQSDIQDLAKSLFINKNYADPFWYTSGALITEAIILGILEKTKIILNKSKTKDPAKITYLLNKFLPNNHFNLASVAIIASSSKDLIEWFKSFPDTSIAKITASQVLQNSPKTLASILMTMATQLAIFKNDFVRNLTCQNDIDFDKLISQPSALFIIIPDENQNYYVLASLLIIQLYKFLTIKANFNENNKLERPVYFLCDEFGNLPAIANVEMMITLARSRNIFFQLIIQDLQQLKEKYGAEIANIIFTNCSLHIFLQTMDFITAEKYSQMIGDKTVIQVSITGKKSEKIQSESLKGHRLILASDLLKLANNQAIIFYAKENPFKASLIPWYQLNTNFQPSLIYCNKKLKLINFEKDYYYDFRKFNKDIENLI